MSAHEERIEFPSDDPVRTYTPEQEDRLSQQLDAEQLRIALGEYVDNPLTIDFVDLLHRSVFGGVKEFAGRHRRDGFGSQRLRVFGSHYSAPRQEVEQRAEDVLARTRKGLESVLANEDDAGFAEAAFHWATWIHAKLVSIQLYEDGNKRVARLIMNCILVRCGFGVLTFEFCREEYADALLTFFDSAEKDVSALTDLVLRTYYDRLQ